MSVTETMVHRKMLLCQIERDLTMPPPVHRGRVAGLWVRDQPQGLCRSWGWFSHDVLGGVLLSRTLAGAVPSALSGLASGFGMDLPGVFPCRCDHRDDYVGSAGRRVVCVLDAM